MWNKWKSKFFMNIELNDFFAHADEFNIRISELEKTGCSVMLRHSQWNLDLVGWVRGKICFRLLFVASWLGLDRLDRVCISGTEWCGFELLSIQFILIIPCKQRCQGILAHTISLFYIVRALTPQEVKFTQGDSFPLPWAVHQPSPWSWE